MAIPLVSGVYSRFRDLSTVYNGIPSTIACYCFVSDRGIDNKLQYISSDSKLINHYGEPNIEKYGAYSYGLLNAKNTCKITQIYGMRVLPDDATYSNFVVALAKKSGESEFTYIFEQLSFSSENSFGTGFWEIGGTSSATAPAGYDFYLPLAIFYAEGRGEWYNRLKVRVTKVINAVGQYNIDLYELKDTGDWEYVDGIIVATNHTTLNDAGQAIYIENEVNEGIKYLKCMLNPELTNDQMISQIEGSGSLTDTEVIDIVDSPPMSPSDGDTYFITDRPEDDFIGHEGELATWVDATSDWNFVSLSYGSIFKNLATDDYLVHYGSGFVDKFDIYLHGMIFQEGEETYSGGDDLLYKELGNGSEGSMVDVHGKLISNEAKNALVDAYMGDIDKSIMDKENIIFSMLFDAGYPVEVKDAIVSLANLRQDCFAFMDNGDHYTSEDAVNARKTETTYNTQYAALYECYTEVNVPEFRRKIYMPPSYHLSYMVPKNDRDFEVWYAIAGFNRGVIGGIKNLRYNADIGEREQLKLYQINPIVSSTGETAIMEQRTTLIRPSKFQSIHIVRLIIHIDRNLSKIAKYFLFEHNDQFTWSELDRRMLAFLDSLERALESKSVTTGADEFEKANRMCSSKIELKPIDVIERILLEYTVR